MWTHCLHWLVSQCTVSNTVQLATVIEYEIMTSVLKLVIVVTTVIMVVWSENQHFFGDDR